MANPFVAEIRIFAGNFAPVGWSTCDGQLIPISQNTALFSLLGTQYGGNGTSNFALPNFQGRAPMHTGQGPGLTDRVVGETGGSDTVTLPAVQMPAHAHASNGGYNAAADQSTPVGNVPAVELAGVTATYADDAAPGAVMAPDALSVAGGGQPHNNLQPYVTLLFIIALQGVFPPRS